MSQRYNNNSKKAEVKIKSARDLMHFAGKFSRGPQVQDEALLGLCIFPLKVAATLLKIAPNRVFVN